MSTTTTATARLVARNEVYAKGAASVVRVAAERRVQPQPVLAGMFAVTDAEGNALCHAPRQNKSANSRVRAAAREDWLRALKLAGLTRQTDAGLMLKDSESGAWVLRGEGVQARDGFADFAHDVADERGGAFCGCNAAPVEHVYQRDVQGLDRLTYRGWNRGDMDAYAEAFRLVALDRMTGTKRARAI